MGEGFEGGEGLVELVGCGVGEAVGWEGGEGVRGGGAGVEAECFGEEGAGVDSEGMLVQYIDGYTRLASLRCITARSVEQVEARRKTC